MASGATQLIEKTTPMLLEKTELPVVAIEEMNKTHENEVEIINALYNLIIAYRDGQPLETELSAAVDQFGGHVEHHFSREEQMMEQYGFPAFQIHKGEHDRVRIELQTLLNAWREGKDIDPLASYLENIHPGWAKNHIATMDMMTAMFIKQASGGY
jgi:hemerythrin